MIEGTLSIIFSRVLQKTIRDIHVAPLNVGKLSF